MNFIDSLKAVALTSIPELASSIEEAVRRMESRPGNTDAALIDFLSEQPELSDDWRSRSHLIPDIESEFVDILTFIIKKRAEHLDPSQRAEGGSEECKIPPSPTMPKTEMNALMSACMSSGRRLGEGVILSKAGTVVAKILPPRTGATVKASSLESMLSIGRTLTAQKLMRYMISEVYYQRYSTTMREPRTLTIEGGLTGLAAILSLGTSHEQELKESLDMFQRASVQVKGDGDYHGLLTWYEAGGEGQGKRILRIDVSEYFVGLEVGTRLHDSFIHRESRKLIPVTTQLPALVGAPNSWGAQARLQQIVLMEFRDCAVEMMKNKGFVIIPLKRWKELSEQAGFNPDRLPEILNAWVKVDGEVPAFLDCNGQEGERMAFALSKAYEDEKKCIEEAAVLSISNKARYAAQARLRHKKSLLPSRRS